MNTLAKISDFAYVYAGGGAPQNADDFSEDGIPFLRAGSLPKLLNGAKESDLEKITNEVARKHKLQLHKKGSVVFAKSGMSATKGHIYRLKNDCYVVNHLAVIKPNEICDSNYLEHALKKYSPTKLILDAAYPSIRLSDISDFKIPLPPLAQQKRIAAILDKVADIKVKREQTIVKLNELVRSTFVEMFGDVITNDKSWQIVTLGSITSKLGSGATPSGGDASYKSQGIPLIRSLNVHDGEFVYKNLAYIDDEQAEKLSNVIVQKNDVLLNITGASVARVCRVPDAIVPARVNQHVMIVRPTEKINPIFLEWQLLTARMKQKLLQVGGAGATREAITKAQATELNVICPPIAIQIKFADIASRIEKLKAQEIAGLESLQKLNSSLQYQAFTSGFVV